MPAEPWPYRSPGPRRPPPPPDPVQLSDVAKLSRVEQIKAFTVLPTFWLPDSEELTPTMKVKRRVIEKKYAAEIEATYDRAAALALVR